MSQPSAAGPTPPTSPVPLVEKVDNLEEAQAAPATINLPSFVPSESFLRLSPYAQQKVLALLLSPPITPSSYLAKEDRFRAAGYQSYVHYQIACILEQLEY
jgi:hypothetical protein